MLARQPDWFRELGNPAGIQDLERLLDVSVPEPLSIFYRYPAYGCWLMAHHATEIFFDDRTSEKFPYVAWWYDRPHLIIAELPQSGLEISVQLNSSNPRMEWGESHAQSPLDFPAKFFADFLRLNPEQVVATCGERSFCTSCASDTSRLSDPDA